MGRAGRRIRILASFLHFISHCGSDNKFNSNKKSRAIKPGFFMVRDTRMAKRLSPFTSYFTLRRLLVSIVTPTKLRPSAAAANAGTGTDLANWPHSFWVSQVKYATSPKDVGVVGVQDGAFRLRISAMVGSLVQAE